MQYCVMYGRVSMACSRVSFVNYVCIVGVMQCAQTSSGWNLVWRPDRGGVRKSMVCNSMLQSSQSQSSIQ